MKNKKITNKEIVKKALLKAGHSLSIDEASSNKDRYLFIFLKEKYDLFGVGIKKYFHFFKEGCHLVSIFEDEILGKHGYCTECESPMIWNKERGWRAAREDEYFDLPLDKSFFKLK